MTPATDTAVTQLRFRLRGGLERGDAEYAEACTLFNGATCRQRRRGPSVLPRPGRPAGALLAPGDVVLIADENVALQFHAPAGTLEQLMHG